MKVSQNFITVRDQFKCEDGEDDELRTVHVVGLNQLMNNVDQSNLSDKSSTSFLQELLSYF